MVSDSVTDQIDLSSSDVFDLPFVKYKYNSNQGVQRILDMDVQYKDLFQQVDVSDILLPPDDMNMITKCDLKDDSRLSNRSQGRSLVDVEGNIIVQRKVEINVSEDKQIYDCIQIRLFDDVYANIYKKPARVAEEGRFTDILQRVIRHNLRNDLNVVMGISKNILNREEVNKNTSRRLRQIISVCSDLISISKNVSTIDSIRKNDSSLSANDIVSITNNVLTKHRAQYDEASISLEVSTTQTKVLSTDHTSTMIDHLVENALEHNSGDAVVEVSITETQSNNVLLSVADNGPGIPQMEQKVVTGEQPIEDVYHASSLGLWVVRWIVDQHEADIEFTESNMGGTKVLVELATVD